MARSRGQRFPSDHRRYYRMMEDIIDDQALVACSSDAFRFYVRLLAMLNRTKRRDGEIEFDRYALNACALKEQRRAALRIAREAADLGLIELSENGDGVRIRVPNWAETQGYAPPDAQDAPAEAPSPTPTPIPKKKSSRRSSEPEGEEEGDVHVQEARRTWQVLRQRAKYHGVEWEDEPSDATVEIVASRLRDGLAVGSLVEAIDGFVMKNGLSPKDGFDPVAFFRPQTLFRIEKVHEYRSVARQVGAHTKSRTNRRRVCECFNAKTKREVERGICDGCGGALREQQLKDAIARLDEANRRAFTHTNLSSDRPSGTSRRRPIANR